MSRIKIISQYDKNRQTQDINILPKAVNDNLEINKSYKLTYIIQKAVEFWVTGRIIGHFKQW